jgi:pimeloyl-ACP methyl ester carboxylesterase
MADEVALVEAARAVAATELDRRLGSLTVPTLVIAGRLDFTASPEGARRIAQALPAARLVELPLTGHHPMDERPERFRAIVDAWLAAAGQAPGADGIRAEGSMP